jgi:hypothetical protein
MTILLRQIEAIATLMRRSIAAPAVAAWFVAASIATCSFAVEVYPITNASGPQFSAEQSTSEPSARYDLVVRDNSVAAEPPPVQWASGPEIVVEPPNESWTYESEFAPAEYPQSCDSNCSPQMMRPYRPGHPTWMDEWGCGGSPYVTGPGRCDEWKVGPVWDVVVDGQVLFREDADLDAIQAVTNENSQMLPIEPLIREQFDYAVGGRLYLTSILPKCAGYQVQFGYMGVEDWNASIIYPKETITPLEGLEFDETRSVYLRSTLHSAEINFMRTTRDAWKPFWGVRYILFDDDIRDRTDQDGLQLPIAGPGADPVGLVLTDMTTAIDIKNNLIGPQIGIRHDLWQCNRWLFLQGFANAGVYYNKTKRTDLMRTFTTTDIADDTDTPDSEAFGAFAQSRTSTTTELSQLAFVGEASLTLVCKLNECLALRGGYQLLWIDGIHMAEDAFLDINDSPGAVFDSRNTVLQGWHAGIEYRR